jgi:hypothetical protein
MICFPNIVVQTIFYKRNTIPTILHTTGPFFHFYHCSEATDGMFIFQQFQEKVVDTEQICPQKLQYGLVRHTAFQETLASFIRWRMYIWFLALFEYVCKITQDNDILRNMEEPNEIVITASEVHNM